MFKGSFVAIVTPFNEDLSVNFDELTRLLNWHVEQQTDGIVILGTTGEAPTLSEAEKLKVFQHTVQVINGRLPVIAGTGSNDTLKTVSFSKQVESLGVDGLLIVSPYYNKGNRQGVIRHFTSVADAVNIPILLYNVPSRTGVNLDVDVVLELSRHPRIVGLKEASGDLSYATAICAKKPDDFVVFSGNDDLILPLLSVGGVGVISVAANVMPSAMHELVFAFLEGDIGHARKLQLDYLDLIHALFIETNPIPVKAAVSHIGFKPGGYRLPLAPLSEENREVLDEVLRRYFS